MNRSNKRKCPQSYDVDSDSDSDFDPGSEYCSDDASTHSSDSELDYESENENAMEAPQPSTKKPIETIVWKDVCPGFSPRMGIPEREEPETTCDENCSISEVFLKLFPKSLFMWIAECTNERLQILSEKKQKPIVPTDYHEIMVVMGCLLVMSYNHVPHMYMYWSQNKSVRNETIATSIARDRFMLLHSKLYFNRPNKPDDAGKTYYMDELLNCLKFTFNRARSEATYQSIDETMIKFEGRSAIKQYVPIKPIDRGIKGWTRADAESGYVYDCSIYCGKDDGAQEGTLGERVVKALCSTLRKTDVAIVVDRFFMSVNLVQTLPFACVGTVRSNRKNLPCLKGTLERGQSVAKCIDDGIICFKWQDCAEVMLLSNCHTDKIGSAERTLKDGTAKEFDCPEAFIFYNAFMGGVDKADQYSSVYDIDRKSNKWWKRVFQRLLLLAVSNSWILYKKFQKKEMSLIDFLMPLSEDILEIGLSGTKNLRKSGSGRPSNRSKLMINVRHQPLRNETRRRCRFGSRAKKQVRTYYICNTCDVPLCVDCFLPYHK